MPPPPHVVNMFGNHPVPLGDSLRLSANIEHWDTSEVRYLRSSCGWLRFHATTVAPGFYYVWVISDRDTTHVGCCDLYFADSLGQADTADSQVCVVRGTGIATAPSPPRPPHLAQGGAPGGRALPIREGLVRELVLWPNPASGVVTVEGLRADAIVRVYSLDGRLQRGVRRLGASTLDLRALPDGVYAIRVGTAVGHVTVLR